MQLTQTAPRRYDTAVRPASSPAPRPAEEPRDGCVLGEGPSMVVGGLIGLIAVGAFAFSRIDPATATELTLQAAFLLSVAGGAAGAVAGRAAHRHFCGGGEGA
ncbi:MAG: hypothetical protein AB1758_04440 [Candidatus Eremiobacterota bacterium]